MRFFTNNAMTVPAFSQRLFRPVDNSPLIIFRIIFGLLLAYHFSTALFNGTIYLDFIKPPFTFNYIGFEFLQPLPGYGMYYYVGLMIILALMIMLGAWYRVAMITFTLLWTMLYLMQKAGYNNHYYLMLLLCWIMVFMPANRYCSMDVKRKAVIKTTTCPQYCIWIFMAQVAIVYFFSAISKLTPAWLSGKFIAIQFSRLSVHHIWGIMYGAKWFQLMICYGGFFFDLLIVPLLLWKRTRNYAFLFSCLFHLFNSFTFRIGIFPYLAIALNLFFIHQPPTNENKSSLQVDSFKRRLISYGFGIYLLFQAIIPMRSWLFPGNVFWNEEGYRMSWKMMLRTKGGTVYFKVVDPVSGKTWKVDPAEKFSPAHVMWLSISPDIIWQYAQRVKQDFAERGFPAVKVYAIGQVTLNRDKPRPLVDTTVDLAKVEWHPFRHSTWITK